MEMRPWVVRGVSSGTRFSREAEHHSKTTRSHGELPRVQYLKMWKQFGGLCMRIVGEPLRTLLQSLMCHTEQSRQFSRVIWTCTALLQSSCPGFLRRRERVPCCNLSRASSACPGWPILHVEVQHWGRELGLRVWSRD
jgi:hypothetical protein